MFFDKLKSRIQALEEWRFHVENEPWANRIIAEFKAITGDAVFPIYTHGKIIYPYGEYTCKEFEKDVLNKLLAEKYREQKENNHQIIGDSEQEVKLACRCNECGHSWTELKSESSRGSLLICPKCGGTKGSNVELKNTDE